MNKEKLLKLYNQCGEHDPLKIVFKGRLRERKEMSEEIWADLLKLISTLNLSIYKQPLESQTQNFVDFFRKEVTDLIKKYKTNEKDEN